VRVRVRVRVRVCVCVCVRGDLFTRSQEKKNDREKSFTV